MHWGKNQMKTFKKVSVYLSYILIKMHSGVLLKVYRNSGMIEITTFGVYSFKITEKEFKKLKKIIKKYKIKSNLEKPKMPKMFKQKLRVNDTLILFTLTNAKIVLLKSGKIKISSTCLADVKLTRDELKQSIKLSKKFCKS